MNNKKPAVIIFTMFILLLSTVSAGIPAEVGGDLVFILDASGSMWGQIDGKPKIEVAKEALIDLLENIPEGTNVGLTAYGHRHKSDCNDVEELAPLGPIDKPRLIDLIKKLSPKGKTPLSRSVRSVAEKLKLNEEQTTIILVSDGKETCDDDPCALVNELKDSGIKFVMHVIGFDVNEEERKQLDCIAQAGGGSYFSAADAGQFREATRQAVEEAGNFGLLKIKPVRNGQEFDALAVITPETETESNSQEIRRTRLYPDVRTSGIRLKPGVYEIYVLDDETQSQPKVQLGKITIETKKTVERTADFSSGQLNLTVLKNGRPTWARVSILKSETDKEVARGEFNQRPFREILLLPGKYDLKIVEDNIDPRFEQTIKNLIIQPGQTVDRKIDIPEGYLSVKILNQGQPIHGWVYIYQQKGGRSITANDTSVKNPVVFKLQPGSYYVTVDTRKIDPPAKRVYEVVEVKAGETNEIVNDFAVSP